VRLAEAVRADGGGAHLQPGSGRTPRRRDRLADDPRGLHPGIHHLRRGCLVTTTASCPAPASDRTSIVPIYPVPPGMTIFTF
jgi:hypothetical protein